jgi:hypothetical protein
MGDVTIVTVYNLLIPLRSFITFGTNTKKEASARAEASFTGIQLIRV